MNTSQEHIN